MYGHVEEDSEMAAMLECCTCPKPIESCMEALTKSYESDPPELNPPVNKPRNATCGIDLGALAGTKLPHSRRTACYCSSEEVKLLYEIFFPVQFGLPVMTRPEGKPLLQHKLYLLLLTVSHGVGAYPDEGSDATCMAGVSLLSALADIRESLKTDISAAFVGDPACRSYSEVIRCYPGFAAMLAYRCAHVLYKAGAALYARELAELAHCSTGVDIHPGATIGNYCFIDHATGTVIGETAVLGEWCRLYQSVTIGALHFAHDPTTGALQKGYKRHPTIGNNVVIGSGAKLLGPIVVGDDVSIGANCWIQEDVPSNTSVVIKDHPQQLLKHRPPSTRPGAASSSRSPSCSPSLQCSDESRTPSPKEQQ